MLASSASALRFTTSSSAVYSSSKPSTLRRRDASREAQSPLVLGDGLAMGAEHCRAPRRHGRVLQHGRRIAGELGVVGAHRGVDTARVEESAEDRVMQSRSPRRRDRGVDDLPGELVSER